MPYKFPKNSNIEDATKIYLLSSREQGDFITVRVVFSVRRKDDSHSYFIEQTKDFVEHKGLLFDASDVERYEEEEAKEEADGLDVFADDCFEEIEGSNNKLWNPPAHAFSRLLDKRIKGLIERKDAWLDYDPELNLFSYFEYVTNCFTTRGALADLKDIKDGKELGHFVVESYLISLLNTLRSLWH